MSPVKQNESTKPLTPDERLSGVLFQFVQLHNRWSEDRQALVGQAEKLEAVLAHLSAAAKAMREFEPRVGQAIEASLRGATPKVVQVVLNAAGDLKDRTDRLGTALAEAESLLERYEVHTLWPDWKQWITMGLTTIVCGTMVGLLVARLAMPTVPVLLTHSEAEALQRGETFALVWPLMSPAEQKHYAQLAKKVKTHKR